jgi:hypothetical protein
LTQAARLRKVPSNKFRGRQESCTGPLGRQGAVAQGSFGEAESA